ncbi:MAG: L-lactate dehydrogenase [Anaerolineae bacterium]|nr:L-lactate dehydrogenase [Gloeobacterales cyanobacterium ES-bin-313]
MLKQQLFKNVISGESQRCYLSKGAIIGAGQVGMACAYSMLIQNTFDELVLTDINKLKLEGEVMDLMHGLPFVEPTQVKAGTFEDCQGADIVIITAGAKQRPGETRLDLVQRNAQIFQQLIPELVQFCPDAIFVVVSNPVDIMTYLTLKLSGFPPARVIGSGTILDTARFRALLAQKLELDPRNVHAYIIGEHGDSELPIWNRVNVAGMNLRELNPQCGLPGDPDQLDDLFQHVKNAGYEIIQRKGATCYAIGLGVTQLVHAILNGQNRIFTVSTYLDGQYGLKDVCLSLPSVLSNQGVVSTINVALSAIELEQLQNSANILKKTASQIQCGLGNHCS